MQYPLTGYVTTEGFGEFLESQTTSVRNNIKSFGAELKEVLSADYITLVNSGSSANFVACKVLREMCNPPEGAKPVALTSGFTFPTTMTALIDAGFEVKVVDTEAGGFNISVDAIRENLTDDVRVICVTHFLGFPARIDEIKGIAESRGILILQDACETFDLKYKGVDVHRYGDITTYSFYHPHHLSSFGGGAIVSRDEQMHRVVESVSHWGRECTCHFNPSICKAPKNQLEHNFYYTRQGYNLEMSELNACFGRFSLRTWDAQEEKRKMHYEILHEALSDIPSITVYDYNKDTCSPFIFPITIKGEADGGEFVTKVYTVLKKEGIEIRSLMGGTITNQPAYKDVSKGNLKNCLKISEMSFMVGIHQTLKTENVAHVAARVKNLFEKWGAEVQEV